MTDVVVPTRADYRRAALRKVDDTHAHLLNVLSGSASIEERDTWKTKEEAARAFEAAAATPAQAAMLGAEAQGVGITEADLATAIIAKADAFLALVGGAAGLRAKGRAAIMAATDEAVPLDQVTPAIEALFAQLELEAQAAISQFSATA